mmetsp:Transcript_90061/g.150566  ORF Transcript_90061/g.150566 Transcript_90061/m.150566 type:complete len:92 (+) Transcript_90061:59-334(+)
MLWWKNAKARALHARLARCRLFAQTLGTLPISPILGTPIPCTQRSLIKVLINGGAAHIIKATTRPVHPFPVTPVPLMHLLLPVKPYLLPCP